MTKDEWKKAAISEAFDGWGSSAGAYGYLFEAGYEAGKLAAQPQWKRISVDGLPPVTGEYLVTVEDLINHDPQEAQTMWFHDCIDGWDANPEVVRVVAWMEKPKPLDHDLNTEASDGTLGESASAVNGGNSE
jgi:hypothetical protein